MEKYILQSKHGAKAPLCQQKLLTWWRLSLLAAVLLTTSVLRGQTSRTSPEDFLEHGFQHPPASARMQCYWWWLNGNTNEATITHDLEEMKAKGYGGANLVDADGAEQNGNNPVPAGPNFNSPRWRHLYLHALREAGRLNLEISLNITSGWNLGGPTVKPEQASKVLTWSRTIVEEGKASKLTLQQPPAKNGFYRDIAVLAYPLRHGQPLAGEAASGGRQPIRNLKAKDVSIETGFSMPSSKPLLNDYPAQAGEEDTHLNDVEDLTAKMTGSSQLAWNARPGTWEVLRIGYTDSDAKVSTASGAWQGLAIDYLDHTAFDQYWADVVKPLLELSKPSIDKSLKYLVTDSWELGGTNWTARFRDEFRRRRGYDPVRYLPVVAERIVGDRETSNRFLNDLRRTVGDLIVDEHYKVFAAKAQGYGLGIHPESGGPHGAPIDAIETLGVSAYPQTEFWAVSATHRSTDEDRFFVKEASSTAHVYGKQLVAGEGMTSVGPQWEETIWNDLRPTFDHALTEGLNLLIWHEFTSSPKEGGSPGPEYFAGTHLNPKVTWWNQAGPFIQYINRSQFLLQQGRPVSDVVYYYGDVVPNFARLKTSDPAKVLPGYDYDAIDENALLHRATVKDGRIMLPDGVSYRLLVLPDMSGISTVALRKIQQLVKDGALIEGEKPEETTGLTVDAAGDKEVRAITGAMWGDCSASPLKQHAYGQGRVFCGQYGRGVLAAVHVAPDFESATANAKLDYAHREVNGTDIYFVRNDQPQAVKAEAIFRIYGKAPELWHQDSGEVEQQFVYDFTKDKRTRVPLWLEPYGSTFVIFRKPSGTRITQLAKDGAVVFPNESTEAMVADPGPKIQLSSNGSLNLSVEAAGRYEVTTSDHKVYTATVPAAPARLNVEGPWRIYFSPGWGAPASIDMEKLQSWTESKDAGVRYFSGTARYEKTIDVPGSYLRPGNTVYLNLGEVREIAEVRLNGKPLGIAWKKPFRMVLNGALKPGANKLEVEVTNLWPNRLIGDQQLPPEQRLTHTNITKFHADSPLLPSGLLGPVFLSRISVMNLINEPSDVVCHLH